MQDFCVIKLNKDKFRNFRKNILGLGTCWSVSLKASDLTVHIPGPEISPADTKKLMHKRFDAPHGFLYRPEGLFELRGNLTQEEIHTPNNKTPRGNPIRLIIRRGLTHTTVGGLSGFLSHVRRYSPTGNIDSVEVAIHPHNGCGPFFRGGDSGSVVVDALSRFVALLTGRTGSTNSSDITFGTPMHWIWLQILAKFEGAIPYWDDDDN